MTLAEEVGASPGGALTYLETLLEGEEPVEGEEPTDVGVHGPRAVVLAGRVLADVAGEVGGRVGHPRAWPLDPSPEPGSIDPRAQLKALARTALHLGAASLLVDVLHPEMAATSATDQGPYGAVLRGWYERALATLDAALARARDAASAADGDAGSGSQAGTLRLVRP